MHNTLIEERQSSTYSIESIIGSSIAVKKIRKAVADASNSDTAVLITGKSGTGKELAGKTIHYNSVQGGKTLWIFNCSIIEESLHERELFGSGTNSPDNANGLIAEVEGGTLILDEISRLSLPAQSRLQEYLRNNEERFADKTGNRIRGIRIIALTRSDLKRKLNEGNFNENLFSQLNRFTIGLPPLAERKQDITLLLRHFLDIEKINLHKPKLSFSIVAERTLNEYSWPGNVRELKNTVERCAIFDGEGVIKPDDLPKEIYYEKIVTKHPKWRCDLPLEELEKRHILAVLRKNKGNKSRTAAILNISRGALIYKIKEYKGK